MEYNINKLRAGRRYERILYISGRHIEKSTEYKSLYILHK